MSELMLECARKAYPKIEYWSMSGGRPACLDGGGKYEYFDLDDLADQMALQIALERERWRFFFDEEFMAQRVWREGNSTNQIILHAKTKPELLAQCVSTTAGR